MKRELHIAKVLLLIYCLSSVTQISGCKKSPAAKPKFHQDTNRFAKLPVVTDNISKKSIDDALVTLKSDPKTWEDYDSRINAVKLLGNLHAVEAVPILVDGLMRFAPVMSDNIGDLNVPASEALIQIGEPAVSQVVQRFEASSNRLEELILLNTLVKIKGKTWVIDYLQHSFPVNAGSRVKQNLPTLKSWVKAL